MTELQPYRIDVAPAVLDDLRRRLESARWPDAVADDWDRGTAPGVLRDLVDRWRDGYDWHATQQRLNGQGQRWADVEGVGLHVQRAGTPGGTPLLLLHGWPDSFLRFEALVPLLAADVDLVVPSIPGFGFSERPAAPGSHAARVADLFAALMTQLGFDRFGVHGGDVGGGIADQLAIRHPERLIGLHLTDVPLWHTTTADPATLTPAQQQYLAEVMRWVRTEGAYAMLQQSKPQTLAYSLNDSPIGLAAWMLEKFRAWSDCGGDVFSRFTPDTLLDHITLYWITETPGSAARMYYETGHMGRAADDHTRIGVPTAIARFPQEILPAPRESAERAYDLRRWTELPRGGHFAAMEEPALLAADLREFFGSL